MGRWRMGGWIDELMSKWRVDEWVGGWRMGRWVGGSWMADLELEMKSSVPTVPVLQPIWSTWASPLFLQPVNLPLRPTAQRQGKC